MLGTRSTIATFTFFFSLSCVVTVGLSFNESSDRSSVEQIPPQPAARVESNHLVSERSSTSIQKNQKPVVLMKKETKETTSYTHITDHPTIIIYHSHNRESWIPELDQIHTPDQAFDSKINVTLLGSYLQQKLQASSVPVFHSDIDYPSRIPNFDYAKSYSYSKQSVKQELRMHKNVKYLFDLHRDSQGRNHTTIQFNNQNYAQVYFVVGTMHSNWKENKKFAERLQEGLNNKVPNLSKGIYEKDKSAGNGEYNQSFSSNSALIEIGGVENSLEESYRTIEVLAHVIQEIWSEDQSRSTLPKSSDSAI